MEAVPPCPLCHQPSTIAGLNSHGFTIRHCPGCTLGFLHPQPGALAIERLYQESYFHNASPDAPGYDRYVEEIPNHRLTFDRRLRFLTSGAQRGRLLDVGASTGVFVERANLHGWIAEGIEPSKWASTYARATLNQPVRTGTIEEAEYPSGSFNMVTMWEVIEHLPDPRATLREIWRVLVPGGTLALSTPDAGSRVARVLGNRWPGWKKIPEHLYYFNQATLSRLLTEAGYEVTFKRYVSLTVSLGYLLERVRLVIPIPWDRLLPASWAVRPVTVNPWYDLMVIARRVG